MLLLNFAFYKYTNKKFLHRKVLDTMYIVSLIKLSSREGNIAILVSINIAVASNMFSIFSIGIKLHCVIGIHDTSNRP